MAKIPTFFENPLFLPVYQELTCFNYCEYLIYYSITIIIFICCSKPKYCIPLLSYTMPSCILGDLCKFPNLHLQKGHACQKCNELVHVLCALEDPKADVTN